MADAYQGELRAGVAAVRRAAKLCQAVQSEITPDVLAKKDRSPVTVADFGSQAVICRALYQSFPDDPIVAEEDSADLQKDANRVILDRVLSRVSACEAQAEAGEVCAWIDRGRTRQYSSRFWTLDPIDGTKGFLRGEQYAVALALIIDGQIAVGVLGCPNLRFSESVGGTIFYAVRGAGAYALPLDDSSSQAATPVQVNNETDPTRARFCESVESGHSSHNDAAQIAARLGISQPPLRMDSQAKYAVVARGEADVYLRMPTRADYQEKIWDHAAGVLLVLEAGGQVSDISGKPLEFHHGPELAANRGVVVSNGRWHDRLIAAVSSSTGSRK